MQGTHQTRMYGRIPRPEEKGSPAVQTQRRALPRWESFPLEDRHRLVRTILQTARRQVEIPPTSSQLRR